MTKRGRVNAVVAQLQAEADSTVRKDMADRYGIHTSQAFGLPMGRLKAIAKPLAPDHALAAELWATGSYEARTIAALIDDPQAVTAVQMNEWASDFDNWAIVDTTCFNLFDKTPSAWLMVEPWAHDERLYVKRAGFALLWALALHDTRASDADFTQRLQMIESNASDDRHLVTKAITMAMRAIAQKRPHIRADVVELAEALTVADNPNARRVGRPIVEAFGPEA